MAQELIKENRRAETLLRFGRQFLPRRILDYVRSPYHFSLALLASIVYRFPGYRMRIVGVTGTKGKSTVVEMVSAILREAKMSVASLSSLRYWIGGDSWPNTLKMTVPGRFKLQEFLRRTLDRGTKYLVLEMTSEGIKQHRHRFISFEGAAITNLHPEHIEVHGSFEAYRSAKGKLFGAAKTFHVLNADDKHFVFFRAFRAKKKLLYSINPKARIALAPGETFLLGKDLVLGQNRSEFTIEDTRFSISLLGKFNVQNALCAVAIAEGLGVPFADAARALAKFERPEGRLEFIHEGQDFGVAVDFAHTPESLQAVYDAVKELRSGTQIVAVLGGTGGGRDKWKRPLMGEIAMHNSRKVFFTNEDPYDEDPTAIVEEVAKGAEKALPEKRNFEKVLDRREAIRKAVAEAVPNDTVVITGKGGEQWMIIAHGRKVPWNDSEIARLAIQERFSDSM